MILPSVNTEGKEERKGYEVVMKTKVRKMRKRKLKMEKRKAERE